MFSLSLAFSPLMSLLSSFPPLLIHSGITDYFLSFLRVSCSPKLLPIRFYYEKFKNTKKFKELYSQHPYTYHSDSTINILVYLPYHISIHVSASAFHQSHHLFLHTFQVKCQAPVPITPSTSISTQSDDLSLT